MTAEKKRARWGNPSAHVFFTSSATTFCFTRHARFDVNVRLDASRHSSFF
jgi:hypothetical protein